MRGPLAALAISWILFGACSSPDVDTSHVDVEMSLEQVNAILERHAARRQAYLKSVQAADTDEQRNAIAKLFLSDWQLAVNELLTIAQQQPSTDVGRIAAQWVVSSCDPDYDAHLQATEILLTEHVQHPSLATVCQHLTGFSPVYERTLREIAASNASAACRAHAMFELAGLLVLRANFKETMEASPELDGERSENMGAAVVTHLEAANPDRDRTEARGLYTSVSREFSDVRYRDGSLGEAAAERLLPLEQTYPEIGTPAPNAMGQDLQGNAMSLEHYRGNVVVMTFWASWCGECINRIPEENQLVESFKNANFCLLGVNGDAMIRDAHRVVEEHSIQFKSWWDNPANETRIAAQWDVTAWPTTFVIDQAGIIRYKNLSGSKLRRVIEQLLQQGEMGKEPTEHGVATPL